MFGITDRCRTAVVSLKPLRGCGLQISFTSLSAGAVSRVKPVTEKDLDDQIIEIEQGQAEVLARLIQ